MRTEQEIRERIVKLEEDIRWYDDYMNNTEKVLHEIEIKSICEGSVKLEKL